MKHINTSQASKAEDIPRNLLLDNEHLQSVKYARQQGSRAERFEDASSSVDADKIPFRNFCNRWCQTYSWRCSYRETCQYNWVVRHVSS